MIKTPLETALLALDNALGRYARRLTAEKRAISDAHCAVQSGDPDSVQRALHALTRATNDRDDARLILRDAENALRALHPDF